MQSTTMATRLGDVVIAYEQDQFTGGGTDLVEAGIGALKSSQRAAFSMPPFRDASIYLSADRQGCAAVLVPASGAGGEHGAVVVIRDDDRADLGRLFAKIAEHIWERVVFS